MWREDYIPFSAWEDADWRLISSDWTAIEDYYEGQSVLEVVIGGTPYKVDLQWELDPDLLLYLGLDEAFTLTYGRVDDADVPIYDEDDGETLSLDTAVDDILSDVIDNFQNEMLPPPSVNDESRDLSGGVGYRDDPAADYTYDPLRHDSPL